MSDQIVDISYAVSPEEAQGRRRMKNMTTGELFWAEEIHALPVADLVSTVSESVVTHAKPVMLSKEQVTPLEDHVVIKPKGKKHGA